MDGFLQHCIPSVGDANNQGSGERRNRRRRAVQSENEVDLINRLADKYDARSVGSFMKKLSENEFKTLYSISSSFKDRVRDVLNYRA